MQWEKTRSEYVQKVRNISGRVPVKLPQEAFLPSKQEEGSKEGWGHVEVNLEKGGDLQRLSKTYPSVYGCIVVFLNTSCRLLVL